MPNMVVLRVISMPIGIQNINRYGQVANNALLSTEYNGAQLVQMCVCGCVFMCVGVCVCVCVWYTLPISWARVSIRLLPVSRCCQFTSVSGSIKMSIKLSIEFVYIERTLPYTYSVCGSVKARACQCRCVYTVCSLCTCRKTIGATGYRAKPKCNILIR